MLNSAYRLAVVLLASVACGIATADEPKADKSGGPNGTPQDEAVTVLCVDDAGKPVVGAELHLFQAVAGEHSRYKHFGPFVSDDQGRVACPRAVPSDGRGHFDRWVYARVPGRLVGIARSANWKGRSAINAGFRVQLEPSRSVEGIVTVPDGFDVRRVTVRTQTLNVNTGPGDFDFQSFPRYLPFAGLDTALPEIFDKQPDSEGRIRFDDVPVRGSLYLLTVGEGLAEAQWRNEDKRFNEPIRLAVAREGVLAGRVELPDGKPAVGMEVAARLSSTRPSTFFLSTFQAVTDEQGRFALHALPATPFVLSVRDPGHQWITRPHERLSVPTGETKEVAISMETGVEVSGRVVDHKGKPVEAAFISALADTEEGPGLADDGTDREGRYQLRLPSGRAKLYFNSLPSGFVYPEPQIVIRLDITGGQDAIKGLDFTLYHNASEAQAARDAQAAHQDKKLAAKKRAKPDPALVARVKTIAQEYAQREREFEAELQVAKHDDQQVKDANERYFADKRKRAEDLMEVVTENATDPAAFEAVLVLVGEMHYFLNDSLTSIVLDHHLADSGMGRLCFALRSRGGEEWAARTLKAAAEKHPQREVRGQAVFALGEYYRNQAFPWGRDLPEAKKAPLVASATRLYQQTLDEFAETPTPDGKTTLGEKASHELARLKNLPDLKVGRPAPPIAAESLDGKPMSLAEYRGRVVLLVFWGSWCGPCMRMVPHERELAERYRDQPFTLLGVNCGDTRELAEATMQEKQMTWRCWWDGEEIRGPIETDYDVPHWPRVFVIDAEGIIRAIDPEADELDRTIDMLLNAETKQ
ncbi:MAG TPA: carboxypeptidase regulatory-like domain-containing protein [Pirellulales bacterium]|nr:carboxypeptidase regulatory-like domain-containing protein [Pirellulales bacterium]